MPTSHLRERKPDGLVTAGTGRDGKATQEHTSGGRERARDGQKGTHRHALTKKKLTRNPRVDLLGDGVDDAGSVRVDALGLQPVPKLVAVLHGVHLRREGGKKETEP